jgi:GNAT superfamily N-acetyltransferase
MSNEQTSMSEYGPHSIELVGEDDLADLLPLMRGYCDFYEVDPSDEELTQLSRALTADPVGEGLQLIARDTHTRAVGFATVYWSWSTSKAARIGVMNDLYVDPVARGWGLADRLIEACVERCRSRGAVELEWQTALDNERAQAVYDRVGGARERWLSYSLEVAPE